MKNLKHLIRNFFGFSKAQTNGFVALLIIISIAIFSRPVYHTWIASRKSDFSKEQSMLDSLVANWNPNQSKKEIKATHQKTKEARLFEFNPNTATGDMLKTLGFTEKLAKQLENYRAKGGKFRTRSDLKKLYGMDSAFFYRLYPFILLPEKQAFEEKKAIETEKRLYTNTEKKADPFNLNEADTLQLRDVYGIGRVLANRIVKYRERLGGFIRYDQLNEVYGLDSAVVNRIIKSSFLPAGLSPRKVNINTADETLLSSHPYFSKKIAKAVVTYRFQHGNYRSVEDLGKIDIIDKQTLERIYPYLTVD